MYLNSSDLDAASEVSCKDPCLRTHVKAKKGSSGSGAPKETLGEPSGRSRHPMAWVRHNKTGQNE